jgi:hypothetical protein
MLGSRVARLLRCDSAPASGTAVVFVSIGGAVLVFLALTALAIIAYRAGYLRGHDGHIPGRSEGGRG